MTPIITVKFVLNMLITDEKLIYFNWVDLFFIRDFYILMSIKSINYNHLWFF